MAEFAPRIRLYGLRHLRAEDQAEDLVQEVLVIVIEALRAGRVEDASILDRYVLGVCRNTVASWRRGERRRVRIGQLFEGADWTAPAPAPPESERLTGCLRRLQPREQSVLFRSYCDEDSAEAIGQALGLSASNVRVLRHRALRRVKDCLEARA